MTTAAQAPRRLLIALSLILILGALPAAPTPTQAQGRRVLPVPICALVAARVLCYAPIGGTASAVTPPGQRVFDFALSPDGEWVVYRTETGQVQIAAVYGATVIGLDTDALPPAALTFDQSAIAWSADGILIAYASAERLRVAYPHVSGEVRFSDADDQLYVNLRFSPGGARLAAQDISGAWTVFTVTSEGGARGPLARVGLQEGAADAAWLDDNSLILAPERGGLMRLNIVDADTRLETAWATPEGNYTRLSASLDGPVLAMRLAPGELNGPIVAIAGDGSVSAFSEINLDARIGWLAPGRMMAYITSGTPILVNPQSGAEDALPIGRATRLAWASETLISTNTLALDADLYYIAPVAGDSSPAPTVQPGAGTPIAPTREFSRGQTSQSGGTRQVWRLPSDGQRAATPITRLPGDVLDYAISADRLWLAVTMASDSGVQLIVLPMPDSLPATPSPTPRRGSTATPLFPGLPDAPGSRILVQNRQTGAAQSLQPTWRADGGSMAFLEPDGVYVVSVDPLQTSSPGRVSTGNYASVQFSPDGRYLLVGTAAGEYRVLPVAPDAVPFAEPTFGAERAEWGLNALLSVRRDGNVGWQVIASDAGQSAALAVSPWPIRDVLSLGSSATLAAQSVLFLRHVGWPTFGPETAQLVAAPDEVRTPPFLLANPLLSPTGRFAAGLERSSDGRMNQLVILDLQNGRKVAVRDARSVSALRWVR